MHFMLTSPSLFPVTGPGSMSIVCIGEACLVDDFGKPRAERKPHHGDFLLLGDDDFLLEAPKLQVLAVAQLRLGHFDRTMVMWDHHCREVASILPAGRIDMSIIIFFIALTFSAKNDDSSGDEERKLVLQIAAK
jgi:hypothetical protein